MADSEKKDQWIGLARLQIRPHLRGGGVDISSALSGILLGKSRRHIGSFVRKRIFCSQHPKGWSVRKIQPTASSIFVQTQFGSVMGFHTHDLGIRCCCSCKHHTGHVILTYRKHSLAPPPPVNPTLSHISPKIKMQMPNRIRKAILIS